MNFARIAAHYAWLEMVFAGGLMQRCRTAFLARAQNRRRALLVGEGTGKFLAELLRVNPHIQVTCVEHCAGMIEQARRRVAAAKLDAAKVRFVQMDVLDWTPPAEKFDLVATNFFLDCFRAEELSKLVSLIAASLTEDAIWLLADFRVPASGWRRLRGRLMLAFLYASFRLTTSLSARWLTAPEPFLRAAGFALEERRLASLEFAHADVWRRKSA